MASLTTSTKSRRTGQHPALRPIRPNWTPVSVAIRQVVERIVERNPHFGKTWVNPTAVDALARLRISIDGEGQ